MPISLDDLSPAALETLAELIERRLEDPDSDLEPTTSHEALARENAARELSDALRDAELVWVPVSAGRASNASLTLH